MQTVGRNTTQTPHYFMKLLLNFLLAAFSFPAFGQNFYSGEYIFTGSSDLSIFKNTKLILNCKKTFIQKDNTFTAWANWTVSNKKVVSLNLDSSKLINSETTTNNYIKTILFDIVGDSLVWKSFIKNNQFKKEYPKEQPTMRSCWKKLKETGSNFLIKTVPFECN